MNIDGCIRAMAQSLATVAAAVADTLVPRICPVCGEVLARDERFVDESRFARAFTNDSVRFSRHGRIKIAYALRQKGVSANVIAEAIGQIDDDEYARMLESLLESRARTLNAASRTDAMGKLLRYAAQRGFEQNLVYPVAQRLADRWNDDTTSYDEY